MLRPITVGLSLASTPETAKSLRGSRSYPADLDGCQKDPKGIGHSLGCPNVNLELPKAI